jgi:hypothetical protein
MPLSSPSLPRSSSSSNKTAVRRASSIALEHKKQLLATNVEEFCNYSRGMIEFQIMALQSELDLLHEFFNNDSSTATTATAGENKDSETTAQIETLFHILVQEQEHFPIATTTTGGGGGGKTISSTILAHGLRTVPGNDAFVARLESAALNYVPSNVDLDLVAFETLLRTLVTVMECTLSQLLELLILHVVFVDTEVGHVVAAVSQQPTTSSVIINTKAVLPTTTTTMSTTTIPSSSNGLNNQSVVAAVNGTSAVDDQVRSAMRDRRMKALFKVFDTHEKASVDFKDIVVGLYKVLDDAHSNFSSKSSSSSAGLAGSPGPLELEASHAAVNALLLFDETQRRELSYRDFARLMLSIVASLPHSPNRQVKMTFDDLADGLTRNASASSGISETYALQKWSMDTTSKLLLDIRADDENDEFTDLGVVEWSKMERLFAFCDTTKDNRISVKELALTLRYVCCIGMRAFLICGPIQSRVLFLGF